MRSPKSAKIKSVYRNIQYEFSLYEFIYFLFQIDFQDVSDIMDFLLEKKVIDPKTKDFIFAKVSPWRHVYVIQLSYVVMNDNGILTKY